MKKKREIKPCWSKICFYVIAQFFYFFCCGRCLSQFYLLLYHPSILSPGVVHATQWQSLCNTTRSTCILLNFYLFYAASISILARALLSLLHCIFDGFKLFLCSSLHYLFSILLALSRLISCRKKASTWPLCYSSSPSLIPLFPLPRVHPRHVRVDLRV